MPPSNKHEETKVQNTLALIRENPGIKAVDTARQTRASYYRVVRRLHGVPRSSSRGGRNKKLDEPESKALKEYLLMYHSIGCSASIDNVIAAANSILRYQGSDATTSRRWAKDQLVREREFIKTLQSKLLEAKRRASYIREDIEAYFREFQQYKNYQGVLDDNIYNFDETGYIISIVVGSLTIVPTDYKVVYIDNPANRELVTSIEYISTGDYYIPLIIIFKGAYYLRKNFKNDIDSNILWACSESGFTNDKLTLSWLKYLNYYTEKYMKEQ